MSQLLIITTLIFAILLFLALFFVIVHGSKLYPFHLLKLLEGGAFVQGFAVIKTDLFIGFSDIKQARFTLDKRKDKIPVL